MKIEGQHVFSAAPQIVWDAVNDPEVLAKVLPGCEDFHATGENQFAGKLKIKVGPVQGDFQGNVVLSELDPPNSYRLQLKGKGAPGFVDGDGQLELKADDVGATVLHYAVEVRIGGRIATVGQRLLDSSSKVITRQALEGLDQQILARAAAAAAREAADQAEHAEAAAAAMPDEAEDAAAADETRREAERARQAAADAAEAAALAQTAAEKTKSQEEFAADFAKGMAKELLPQPWLAIVVFLLIAVFLAGLAYLLL